MNIFRTFSYKKTSLQVNNLTPEQLEEKIVVLNQLYELLSTEVKDDQLQLTLTGTHEKSILEINLSISYRMPISKSILWGLIIQSLAVVASDAETIEVYEPFKLQANTNQMQLVDSIFAKKLSIHLIFKK